METLSVLRAVLVSAMALSLVAGCASMTGRSTGRYMDDKGIEAHVKTKLTGEQMSNLTRIGVNVVNGTVYLTGTVDTPEQKANATDVANRVDGVKSVVNQIEVVERKNPK